MSIDDARASVAIAVATKRERIVKACQPESGADLCEHEWQRFRESITPERSRKAEKNEYYYTQGAAYFVVKACLKCKTKRRIELVVEA